MEQKFNLSEIKTLVEVSKEYNIPITTLRDRLIKLTEGVDFKRLGKRLPTLITPTGIEKIIKGRES